MKPLALASLAASVAVHAVVGYGALTLLSAMAMPPAPRMTVSVESMSATALPADTQKLAEAANLTAVAAAPSAALAPALPSRLEAASASGTASIAEAAKAQPTASALAAEAQSETAAQAARVAAAEPALSSLEAAEARPVAAAPLPTAQSSAAASPASPLYPPPAASSASVMAAASAETPAAADDPAQAERAAAAEPDTLAPDRIGMATATSSPAETATADDAPPMTSAAPAANSAADGAASPPQRIAAADPGATNASEAPNSLRARQADASVAASPTVQTPVLDAAPSSMSALPEAAPQSLASAAPVRATASVAAALPVAQPAIEPRNEISSAAQGAVDTDQEPQTQVAALAPNRPAVGSNAVAGDPRSSVIGFLGTYQGGDCFLALDAPQSEQQPAVAQFSVDTQSLAAFAAAAGAALPGLVSEWHAVGEAQCSALRFARSLPRYPDFSLAIETGDRTVQSGSMLRGVVSGHASRSVYLLLVDDAGDVQPVSQFLSRTAKGGEFAVPLRLENQPKSPAQLLIALSRPAGGLQTIVDGASQPADAFFATLEQEVQSRGLDLDFAIESFLVR